jgi:hypothetical protein
MNVEIGAEAGLFPEKEYLSDIFVAVHTACVRRVNYRKRERIEKVCLSWSVNRMHSNVISAKPMMH